MRSGSKKSARGSTRDCAHDTPGIRTRNAIGEGAAACSVSEPRHLASSAVKRDRRAALSKASQHDAAKRPSAASPVASRSGTSQPQNQRRGATPEPFDSAATTANALANSTLLRHADDVRKWRSNAGRSDAIISPRTYASIKSASAASNSRSYAGSAKARSSTESDVLRVMRTAPRHLFVPDNARSMAYEDYPVSIGYGATISQPNIVALITQLLGLTKKHRILEIGTGSGYQAAILGNWQPRSIRLRLSPSSRPPRQRRY